MMEVLSVRTNASSATLKLSPFDLMTAILKGGNIDLSSSSKSGVSMPPSLAMFVENREFLMLLTTSVSPQNLAIFEASESLRSCNSVCFTVSSMEFEGFYGVGWRSPVSVRATATPGLERFHRKIATMEADDSTRQIITALLRKCSYKVAAVSDGLKAWEVLKGRPHNIDLILTEVELPSISGSALLTLIAEHEVCKNIPVIMMSAHDSVSTVYKF